MLPVSHGVPPVFGSTLPGTRGALAERSGPERGERGASRQGRAGSSRSCRRCRPAHRAPGPEIKRLLGSLTTLAAHHPLARTDPPPSSLRTVVPQTRQTRPRRRDHPSQLAKCGCLITTTAIDRYVRLSPLPGPGGFRSRTHRLRRGQPDKARPRPACCPGYGGPLQCGLQASVPPDRRGR